MKTIHVLGWMDGFEDALGVDLLGKRELDQDAVDVVVVIQVLHNGEKFSRRNSRGRREEATREAKLLAGCNLALYVELGSGDRKSTRLNSSHRCISYAVFCLKKKKKKKITIDYNI